MSDNTNPKKGMNSKAGKKPAKMQGQKKEKESWRIKKTTREC